MNKMGFGFLRLPRLDSEAADAYDLVELLRMVDRFVSAGGRYFDTCYTYLNGYSEYAIRECVTKRLPREQFLLADKIPGYRCKTYEDAERYLAEELQRCGVSYFDVLMLHWLNGKHYAIAEELRQFRFLSEAKAAGKARMIGFSYHDSATLLEEILTAHPEVDVVLLQLNYLDWETTGIESRKCYEVCVRHGKKVLAMEPVKGGVLANLPPEAEAILRALHPNWSPASWAIRFVQSLPEVWICLSGMSSTAQVEDNMQDVAPLGEAELAALAQVRELLSREQAVPCTACGYCVSHCPQHIPIPTYFRMLNELSRYPRDGWKIKPGYLQSAKGRGLASRCIGCGACVRQCPQRIDVPAALKKVAEKLE